MDALSAAQQYKQINTKSSIEDADPHALVTLLFNGISERINTAKFFIEKKDIAKKGESIGSAITILDGLRSTLNMELGGEVSENLAVLYDYMQQKLLSANINNSEADLDEVQSLLNQIRSGWEAIPQQVRDEYKTG